MFHTGPWGEQAHIENKQTNKKRTCCRSGSIWKRRQVIVKGRDRGTLGGAATAAWPSQPAAAERKGSKVPRLATDHWSASPWVHFFKKAVIQWSWAYTQNIYPTGRRRGGGVESCSDTDLWLLQGEGGHRADWGSGCRQTWSPSIHSPSFFLPFITVIF